MCVDLTVSLYPDKGPPRFVSCNVCAEVYERTDSAIKKGKKVCSPCSVNKARVKRQLKRAMGLQKPVTERVKERQRLYHIGYFQREDVKKRNCEDFQRRRRNPVEHEKMKTRRKTRGAIARGELVRQPCEVCGKHKVDAHHDDYSKPFNIRWLCRLHHAEHHALERSKAKVYIVPMNGETP